MKPQRWQEVSRIFKSVIELKAEDRLSFIESQCGGDESLRREVELLIDSHQRAEAENFIQDPAAQRAAALLDLDGDAPEQAKDRLTSGQLIGHYLVIQKLGAGGMGEVYLARDTRLDRTVALKILAADVAADKRRMHRFRQEAKIASSLNQPNILTIFEFGEFETLHFLATEYIDGETLRDRLRGRSLKLSEIFDIATQILSALDAAHEAKIVHRDIKPENIMIRRRDQIVKVLDFGLAKLTEKSGSSTDTEAATEVLVKTTPGSLVGTVNYMSPEQAQILPLDERTDIWSTGVVIYEMISGRPPFRGVTSSHTIVDIIEREPAPLASVGSTKIHSELERIISKALAKNKDERYQTAKDMLIDLKKLGKQIDIETEIKRSESVGAHITSPATDKDTSARTASGGSSQRINKREERQSRTRVRLAASVGAIVIIGAVVIGFYAWRSSHPGVAAPASVLTATRNLSYWITVQKYRDGKPYEAPFKLASEINFENDYQVRLNVSSPQAGYLYILNEGPQLSDGLPSFVVLFPSPTANHGSAALAMDQQIQIPEKSWFQFDKQAGTEKLWLVFSAGAIAQLETLRAFVNPQFKGAIENPETTRGLKEFLEAHSVSKPIVERDDAKDETRLRASGDILVHVIKLAHH